MSKKLLSVMLALVMVLSVFSVAAFAVDVVFEDPDADEAYTQMWFLETTNEPNEDGDYTVDVYLEANYAVGAISFHIDAVGATLKDVIISDYILDAEGYNADDEVNKANGNVYIIPKPIKGEAKGLNFETAELVATLVYSLDAASATITLNNDAKTIDNDGKLIAARLGDGILASNTMYYGQFVCDIDGNEPALGEVISEVTLGSEAAADPVLSGINGGVVAGNGYVYGVPAGTTDFTAYFAVENGTFEITGNGTGATLVVKNAASKEFATYTLIIFGDVNGDGAVTGADSSVVKNAALGGEIDGAAYYFAGDVNGDGSVTGADSSVVKNAALGGEITSNPFAA